MKIEVTFNNPEEEKYIAQTSSSNVFLASIVNLMPWNFDAMTEEEKRSTTVQLEIKDNNGQFVSIQDKIILYKLYQLVNVRSEDIKDISVYSSSTGNLIYSTEAFGYNISSASIGDFYLDESTIQEEEENPQELYPHIFVSIKLVIKEE